MDLVDIRLFRGKGKVFLDLSTDLTEELRVEKILDYTMLISLYLVRRDGMVSRQMLLTARMCYIACGIHLLAAAEPPGSVSSHWC